MKINSIQSNMNFAASNLHLGVRRLKGQELHTAYEPTKSIPSYEYFACYNVPKSLVLEDLHSLNALDNKIYSLSNRILPFSRESLQKFSGIKTDIAHVYKACDGDFEKINEMFQMQKMIKENNLELIK